ncbi:cytochrome o ubiquinol oxidase subunit IV [Bartonella harrusi]|uniref:Cytochrome bo(3) ubiquinol oxidase subunit 4 n=1 Tax=Bartonella harrusi TaxID=2961895 RepID=A0ABY5EVQ9_9HYPH|nr:cytochrome o ubiquinol oxidase subunit IV [Bartonella harrusi]UTO28510.1 cytochrome o ubiquinol oxidase subunit IV [Bartonella harrusi]
MSVHNETHGPSTGSYLIGFILAVFFTMGSFIPVMYGMMESWAISTKVVYLIGMAIIQIIVQIVFFLHLNSGPDAKWNLSALWFAVICVFIIIGGTWWAISHLNYNMMGGSGRVIEPEILSNSVTVPEQLPDTKTPMEQQAPIEQAPGVEMPVGQTPVEHAPGVEMPLGQTPVEQTPSVEMPVGQTPVEHAPGVEMPLGQTPVEQTPSMEMPLGQTPVEQTPSVEMPVGQTPVEQTPSMEMPLEQTPVEQTPSMEMPLGQTPVEQTPGVEMPMEKEQNM